MAEVLSTIRNIGYTGVELVVRDPREINQRKLSKIIMDLQLNVPAICTDVIYWEDNISFAD